jgi:hypothetical protein
VYAWQNAKKKYPVFPCKNFADFHHALGPRLSRHYKHYRSTVNAFKWVWRLPVKYQDEYGIEEAMDFPLPPDILSWSSRFAPRLPSYLPGSGANGIFTKRPNGSGNREADCFTPFLTLWLGSALNALQVRAIAW